MPVRILLGAPEELSHYSPSFGLTISISHAPTFLRLLLSSQNPPLPLSAYLIRSPLSAKELLPAPFRYHFSQFLALYPLSSRHQPKLTGVCQSQFQTHSGENVAIATLPRYSHLVVSASSRHLERSPPPHRAEMLQTNIGTINIPHFCDSAP